MSVQDQILKRSKVAVVRCESYDRVVVERAMQRGIELVGGCCSFAQPGERILFKPNVLWGSNPARCVVTHPEVVRAAVACFNSTNAVLQYGDSSAGLPNAAGALKKSGYPKALASLPVKAVSFIEGKTVEIPAGIKVKMLRIAGAALEADGIINLPKLKTHGLVRMTGAVKNLYGCVPGMTKGQYHALFPDPYDFSMLLADIVMLLRPRLHIMDAVYAMEGNGPQSGKPKKLGVLLFSTDPVALDFAACRLINLNPEYVPTIAAGQKCGLGVAEEEKIDFVGDEIKTLTDRSFKVAKKPPVRMSSRGILGKIRRLFLARPVINRKKCILCGRCIESCPIQPKALMRHNRSNQPVYNYRRCIRCFCCQEICPSEAILIRQPLAGKLLPFAAYLSLLISVVKRRLSDLKR